MKNAKFAEQNAILATIDPQSVGTNAVTSDYVYPSKFSRLAVVVQIGNTVDGGTITVFKSDNTSGSTTTAIQTQAIATNGDNLQYIFDVDVDSLCSAKPYVAVKVVGADTNTNLISATIFGYQAKYEDVSGQDLASANIV